MHPDHTPDAPQLKQCSKCKEWKPATAEFFFRHKREKDGLRGWCKACSSEYSREYRHANRDRLIENGREYYWANKEKLNERSRAAHHAKKEQRNQNSREYYAANKELWKSYAEANRDRINERTRARRVRRRRPRIEGQKFCSKCQTYKPATLEFFPPRKERSDGLRAQCRECRSRYVSEWHQANKERFREQQKAYRVANPISPDRRRAIKNRRRARKATAEGNHTADDIARQYKSQHGKCYYCGTKVGDTYHVDHVIPLSRGGSDGPENIVIACPSCNLSKFNKLPHEWPQGGRLL